MEERLTEELLAELLAAPDIEGYLAANDGARKSLSDYLDELLSEKGLKRSEVVRDAQLNETFGYQIFVGQRNPSRNKVLQLAFAMRCTLRETNRLLQLAGANALYAKDRRDAIIVFALDKGYSLIRTNEELYRFGEDTIC